MKLDSFLMNYILIPGMQISLVGMINLGWFGEESIKTSMFAFLMLVIMCYELGYKRFYVTWQHAYFYVVFLFPVIFSAISLIVWFSTM